MIGTNVTIAATALVIQAPAAPERSTLLQLSLAAPTADAAEYQKAMAEETAKITSCAEGLKLIDRLKARGLHGSFSVTVKSNVALAALPAPLRDALTMRPIGRATPVFGGGQVFRVLIRCEPTFIVPLPAPLPQQRPAPI
ncbi:hypothetical protein [Sphingomonas sp. 28-63-12]|uniref:hypothetical protein n=1 Tax=Sphingomonas sp. 28-63-12 TaxID=1970434 RepID=UPI000BDCF97E|nr:MAG: hypothetical protein B7Y47_14055 [Sphingomonas sp. 28-63-12]